ncbi:MAG: hypothetical protein KDB36_18395, partial [Acidimicrobiales bacterium]|nr:hypothetical protein [Acidimicrobiales bacterium]
TAVPLAATGAGADTLPAPVPSPSIALGTDGLQPDLGLADVSNVNTGDIWGVQSTSGDVWADVSFVANRPNLVVQFSTTKPTMVNGKLSVGAVAPTALNGTLTPTPGQYRYTISREGLTPNTTYYALVTIPGSAGQAPNQETIAVATKTRTVRVWALQAHVSDDADPGLLGKGEIRFGQWIAPANVNAPAASTAYTGTMAIGTGDDVALGSSGLFSKVTTAGSTVNVVVQGIEHDGTGFCPTGVFSTPTTKALDCGFAAAAIGTATLPTAKYGAKHSQIIHATTTNASGLQFQVSLLVETSVG